MGLELHPAAARHDVRGRRGGLELATRGAARARAGTGAAALARACVCACVRCVGRLGREVKCLLCRVPPIWHSAKFFYFF